MDKPTVSLTLNDYQSFLRLAKAAYERSIASEQDAIVAIIFSALSVECFMNGVLEVARHNEDESQSIKTFVQVVDELETQKASIKSKIQLAYFLFTGKRLDIGKLPYQDFDLLLTLRNNFVHGKQDVVVIDYKNNNYVDGFIPHKFVKNLAARKIIPLPPKNHIPQWIPYVTKPDVARWAYNTAVNMITFLMESVPDSKTRLLLRLIDKDELIQS